MSQCHQKTTDMKGKSTGGQQEKERKEVLGRRKRNFGKRATAKDTRAQGKTCGHLLHQRGEGGQKDKERDYISGKRMRVLILL